MNLSAPQVFRSKEISKSGVVDDMVASNPILYSSGEHPDHVIVIKVSQTSRLWICSDSSRHATLPLVVTQHFSLLQYIPYVGDSKRAMDEYTSEIFMGGKNTIVLHNTCEDSLLAAPIILDLVLLAELSTRIQLKAEGQVTDDGTGIIWCYHCIASIQCEEAVLTTLTLFLFSLCRTNFIPSILWRPFWAISARPLL